MIVDSHCHLDHVQEKLDEPLDAIVQRARDAGVEHMLCVSIDASNMKVVADIAKNKNYPDISASVGIHPSEAHTDALPYHELLAYAQDSNIVAIGETGLDYYWTQDHVEAQKTSFKTHIDVAKAVNKPLIIHTRDAREDTLKILTENGAREVGGVLHCFTESLAMAEAAIQELDFYISFSGIITFKNATELQDVVKAIPLEKILIETDSPYLAPVPYRGKVNEPSYVSHVCKQVADLKGVSEKVVAEQTTQNFYNLFKQVKA